MVDQPIPNTTEDEGDSPEPEAESSFSSTQAQHLLEKLPGQIRLPNQEQLGNPLDSRPPGEPSPQTDSSQKPQYQLESLNKSIVEGEDRSEDRVLERTQELPQQESHSKLINNISSRVDQLFQKRRDEEIRKMVSEFSQMITQVMKPVMKPVMRVVFNFEENQTLTAENIIDATFLNPNRNQFPECK